MENNNKKYKFIQQVHIDDNGEIVLVADKLRNWSMICKKCNYGWKLSINNIVDLPKDFKDFE